ncbi:MAG: SAM-dependent methyltransferase [Rhodobacter sp.]|nr:SAM-dependent methyltransferase [Rhodobacter sp.]
MTPSARLAAAIEVLNRILGGAPAEPALTNWGRASRFAGSGDRAAVRDLVFDALRRRRSAAARGGAMTGRGLVLGLCRERGQEQLFSGEGHAPAPPTVADLGHEPDPAEAMDLLDWLLPDLRASLGTALEPVAEALRQRAPVFLRVNLARIDREGAARTLAAEGIVAVPHPLASTALQVTENARKVQASQAYQSGLVELQDASSQAVVEKLPLVNGMRVLDHCAGGGGKTLAMAARADLGLYAHDIAPKRMTDLPVRAKRAGARVTLTADPEAQAPYDLVLVDAPCSGSGSWRRDPEGKWALTPEALMHLEGAQAAILTRTAEMVAPGGMLAYATCSLLHQENASQITRFMGTKPGWGLIDETNFSPLLGGDGFYIALMQRSGT